MQCHHSPPVKTNAKAALTLGNDFDILFTGTTVAQTFLLNGQYPPVYVYITKLVPSAIRKLLSTASSSISIIQVLWKLPNHRTIVDETTLPTRRREDAAHPRKRGVHVQVRDLTDRLIFQPSN